MMRLIALTVIVVALLLSAPIAQQPPDLAGVYTCDGLNDDGQAYHAVVEIVPQGDVWGLRWTFESTGTAIGIGFVQRGVLAVVYQLDNGQVGIVAYAIEQKEPVRLVGRWTVPGAGATSTETLTKTAVRNPALLRGPRRGA